MPGTRSSMARHLREVSGPRSDVSSVRVILGWCEAGGGGFEGACGGEIFSEASGCRAQDEGKHRGSEEQ